MEGAFNLTGACADAGLLEGLDEMEVSLYPFSGLESGDEDATYRDVAAMLNTHAIPKPMFGPRAATSYAEARVLNALGLVPNQRRAEGPAQAPGPQPAQPLHHNPAPELGPPPVQIIQIRLFHTSDTVSYKMSVYNGRMHSK